VTVRISLEGSRSHVGRMGHPACPGRRRLKWPMAAAVASRHVLLSSGPRCNRVCFALAEGAADMDALIGEAALAQDSFLFVARQGVKTTTTEILRPWTLLPREITEESLLATPKAHLQQNRRPEAELCGLAGVLMADSAWRKPEGWLMGFIQDVSVAPPCPTTSYRASP